MNFKSYIIENNYSLIEETKSILFYGENIGLKKKFKENIRNNNKKNKIISFLQDDILKNTNLLLNELNNLSLFEEKKIIFIDNVNDKILKIIEEHLDGTLNNQIFIFGDILDKKSKLRNYYEKSKSHGAVPCYADTTITIQKIIRDELKYFKGLSSLNLNIIMEACGNDRIKVYNEIDKIKSFFSDKNISTDNLSKLLNLPRTDDFNELKDVVIKGNKYETNKLLSSTVIEQDRAVYYLTLISQRFYKLLEIFKIKKGNNILDAVNSIKPPIFWKDKEIIINQAKLWNIRKIQVVLKKLFDVEILLKSSGNINKDLLIKKLLIDVCFLANAS